MDAELRSLIFVLGINFALTFVVILTFTCCQYFRIRKTQKNKKIRSHTDGLLVDEEEEKKLNEDFESPFGPSIGLDAETLSSSSLSDIDFNSLNKYKDNRKMLPKLDPWLFKWIYQIYKISDREIFKFTPADGYLYLYFLKGASALFFVLTILN